MSVPPAPTDPVPAGFGAVDPATGDLRTAGHVLADREAAFEAATDAEFDEAAWLGALSGADVGDRGQDRYGDPSGADSTGSSPGADSAGAPWDPAAPWDMAGDWDRPSGTGASQPVSSPAAPALGTPAPESRPVGTPTPETRSARESGRHRTPRGKGASAESAPQDPVPATGAQMKYPWESGPQPRFVPTGSQPGSQTGAQPTSQTQSGSEAAEPSASRSGDQAVLPTGTQSGSGTGEYPTSSRPPWESGPQAKVGATGAQMSYPWESGPQPRVEPGEPQPASRTSAKPASRTGAHRAPRTGAQPVSSAGAKSESGTGEQPTSARPPWGSGPPDPSSSTGSQSRPDRSWESGPQPRFVPTGPQPGSRAGAEPAARAQSGSETAPGPASRSGAHPVLPAGAQSESGTGPVSRPVPSAGAQSGWGTGPRPVWGVEEPSVSQRPPWESGPQDAASSAGTEPRSARAWESGPQPRFVPTGAQPVSSAGGHRRTDQPRTEQPRTEQPRTGESPALRAGTRPALGTGAQPGYRTGAQPTFQPREELDSPAGTQPAEKAPGESRTEAEPASSSGTRPTGKAPWESGDWGKASDWDASSGPGPRAGTQPVPQGGQRPVSLAGTRPAEMASWDGTAEHPVPPADPRSAERAPWESGAWEESGGNRDALPAPGLEPESEPESGSTGSGAWPAAERPAKPERHSHRAAKHGRPGRRRGSGNRSDGDGES